MSRGVQLFPMRRKVGVSVIFIEIEDEPFGFFAKAEFFCQDFEIHIIRLKFSKAAGRFPAALSIRSVQALSLLRERNAFSTTLSAVKPNISNNLFAGPLAPKVVMPMISP